MILWGRASSVNVQKVLWALDEFGLTFDHRVVGGKFGGLDDPAFAKLAPVTRVPVLEDGGVAIWESHAILRHLARREPEHPLGAAMADPAQAAVIDPWLEFTTSTLQPPFIGLFWQMVRMPQTERKPETIAQHRAALHSALAVPEAVLSDGRRMLEGPGISLADIAMGSLLHRLFDVAPELRDGAPHVAAWHRRLAERSAYGAHVAVSYDELRPT